MKTDGIWPTQQQIDKLPVHPGFGGVSAFYGEQKFKIQKEGRAEVARILVKDTGFADVVRALLDLRVSKRELRAYASPRVGLIPPPVHRSGDDGEYYLYPDHFEILAPILTLRKTYHLPLKTVQDLVTRVPRDAHHMIVHRHFSLEDLLNLHKMVCQGYGVAEMVMSKACDAMLEDVLPPDTAVLAATQTEDNTLLDLEQRLILERLDEIKEWVVSGRRAEYVMTEAEEDGKQVVARHFLLKRIARKEISRRSKGKKG